MFGLIGSFTAAPGKRDELAALMTASVGGMPGCRSYVVAMDRADPDRLWVTEVWESAESHKASLAIPAVAATIQRAMPLIAGFGDHVETVPVGGHGL
jgi:quinol monooxygenase YgiN